MECGQGHASKSMASLDEGNFDKLAGLDHSALFFACTLSSPVCSLYVVDVMALRTSTMATQKEMLQNDIF